MARKRFLSVDSCHRRPLSSQPLLYTDARWMARSHAQDKACIDQTNINSDLRCLPIFLSGCRSLVVLAGPTYSQRLWCVLEIFVFLRTGGTDERVVVHRLGGENVHKALTQFDASKAKCYLHSDRHRLLAVIEAAFGDCTCVCLSRRRWAPIRHLLHTCY